MSQVLSGRKIADDINQEVAERVAALRGEHSIAPRLALLTVGQGDSLKQSEFILHESAARNIGIDVRSIVLPDDATEDELIAAVRNENQDPDTHGILVLLPLPEHIDQEIVFGEIAPNKELEGALDVDDDDEPFDFEDIDTVNGKQGTTITAVRTLLESIDYDIPRSRNVFVTEDHIRDNPLVGRLLRMSEKVNVSVAITSTAEPNVREITRSADLVLVSVSSPEIIDDTYLKKGAVVIDFLPVMVGEKYSKKKGRMVPILKGGVNVEAALRKASHVAPALGSIGPIMIAMMMKNLVLNACESLEAESDNPSVREIA